MKRAPRKAEPSEREVAKQETREALISAAMTAFGEEGLDGPSLDAICERAGFTRGAFYVHFKDREDLIAAVFDRTTNWIAGAMLGVERDFDLGTIVELFGEAVHAGAYPPRLGAVRLPHVLEALARNRGLRDRHLRHIEDVRKRLTEAARGAQRAGQARTDVTPDAIATLLLALVMGIEVMAELDLRPDGRNEAAALRAMLAPRAPDRLSSRS